MALSFYSYSGLQSGMGMDYAVSEDIGNFKVQDIGEGSVKIRCNFLFGMIRSLNY